MLLKINVRDNHYLVEGNLNYSTLQEFNKTFQSAFSHYDEVIVNIEGLKSIDRHGVNAIAKLHNEALLIGKKIFIVGLGNKEIYQHLNSTDAA